MKLLGNKLIPEDGKKLMEKNNRGEMIAERYCPPLLHDNIYLGKQITSLVEASDIYVELSDYEYKVLTLTWQKEVEEEYNKQVIQAHEERLALEEMLKTRAIEFEPLEEE